MKLRFHDFLLAACCAVTMFCLAPLAYAQSSRLEREVPTDDDPLLHPLPPGIRVRAFIHTPRVIEPSHLGICTPTSVGGEQVDWYDCAPWLLPSTGIIWKLNEATVPTGITVSEARNAITGAFSTWSGVIDPSPGLPHFIDGGRTSVKNTRLDGTSAILWKRLREGVVGETYVWYDTATNEVIEVDTAFNNRHPWGILPASTDGCSDPDVFDLPNIATHEFGHWIGLADVFAAVDLTMYLFAAGGEVKKRDLAYGDALGACTIYGTPCPTPP